MPVIAFLSEPYSKNGDSYSSEKGSLNFIRSCFDEQIVVVGRISKRPVKKPSAQTPVGSFEEAPNYESVFDFAKKSLRNPLFFKRYIEKCFYILDKYPESEIWVRNPSIGCIIFSICAIKRERAIYNHMCANVSRAWDNPKYTGFNRVAAYLFSKLLNSLVRYVVKSAKVTNLCTGDELLDYCLSLNSNSHLLIDSNIKKVFNSKDDNGVDCFKFVFVGRVQEDKGIRELLLAFSELKQDVSLDVIGDGPLLQSLKDQFQSPTINFLGQVAHHNLPKHLSKSKVVVVPSKNRYEGFPRVILEAWSHSLPVIVSDVGGVKAFVEHGVNGLIYDNNEPHALYECLKTICSEKNYEVLKRGSARMSKITTENYWVTQFKKIR